MDFGLQIKNLRNIHSLTQEQLSQELNITRQAVSNWENNRNLPDIEMLIEISKIFNISLDTLILGGNNMTKKLIADGNESRRAKMNLTSTIIGGILMALGFICFITKALSKVSIDENGMLQEPFFLIPVGNILIFSGAVVIIGTGISFILKNIQRKKHN